MSTATLGSLIFSAFLFGVAVTLRSRPCDHRHRWATDLQIPKGSKGKTKSRRS